MNKKLVLASALLIALLLSCTALAEGAVQVGDFITFGHYEPDNDTANGQEPIEWRVLEINGSEALIISRFVLDVQPYNEGYTYTNWSKCSLRPWLNEEFYNAAFSDEDKQIILTKVIENWEDADTEDTVFLLDNWQAKSLFADHPDRQVLPTEYAKAQGSWQSKKYGPGNAQWWLRTISWVKRNMASYVAGSGGVMTCGGTSDGRVDNHKWGVRPAIYINLDAFAQ